MMNILDQVARSSSAAHHREFHLESPRSFLALRLAQKLGEPAAFQHYAELAERYSEAQLLLAYRRACAANSHAGLAKSFHVELNRLGNREVNGISHRRLAAIRIERRSVAVAIFNGDRLGYTPMARQLSSDSRKALGSAVVFINRLRDKCAFTTAAMETLPSNCTGQRSQLAQVIADVLAEQKIDIGKVAKPEVLAAFGHPPLRFRQQVREVVSAIWPDLDGGFGTPFIQDALALGLYCQTEYLFNINLSLP